MRNPVALIVSVVVVLFASNMVMFKVREYEQAVVLQFGEPVEVYTEPGLYFKAPDPIQKVVVFPTKLIDYDSDPSTIPTKDKKFLVLDNFARWRIVEPLVFLKSMRSRAGALARLDDIIYSELRNELGQHTLSEIVSTSREDLMRKVTERSNLAATAYGIEVIDVRIKRADLPPENEAFVYNRMRAEREREALRYRSEGEEEALKIRAETDLEAAQITAAAKEIAQRTRGKGDAEALRIYAEAYRGAESFYQFTRTLEAFEKSLNEKTVLVQPADTQFFKYLKGSK